MSINQGTLRPSPSNSTPSTEITALIYELLDAHDDTARMAVDLVADPLWEAHLDYIRALQRKGRELLARADLDPRPSAPSRRHRGTWGQIRRNTTPGITLRGRAH